MPSKKPTNERADVSEYLYESVEIHRALDHLVNGIVRTVQDREGVVLNAAQVREVAEKLLKRRYSND